MRIVIDTNLIIAARFNPKSASAKIIEKVEKGGLELIWSDEIYREAMQILQNVRADEKFRIRIEKILSSSRKVTRLPRINIIREDPSDNMFLAAAVRGNADYIVSNDRHLLRLKGFRNIPIVSSTQALQLFHPL
ncbi:MAG TPA: putative toxin-antitoxin system toxin component, PIN family [Thermodesulfobacteriota bacterium]|nr:putative toxin-antitoxin system toxin component, PIN family [Thermodesulfobacteriota bacterium]